MPSVKITIPRADEKEVVIIPKGNLGFQEAVTRKFEKIDGILFGIIAAVLVSLVAVIVAVIGLFIDQMRYNNAAYKEYTEEVRILNARNDSNVELLRQNMQNQEIITRQQLEIIELLNKRQ